MEASAAREASAESWADMSGVAEVSTEEGRREGRDVMEDEWDAHSCSTRRSRTLEEQLAAMVNEMK